MKNQKNPTPTPSKLSILRQLCNLIPNHLVPNLARETGVDAKARTYSPWSHVVTLIFSQIGHSLGLNDVCDALELHSGPLSASRGATPPSPQQPRPCEQEPRCSHGRAAFLEHARIPPEPVAGFRARQTGPRADTALPPGHSYRGLDHHRIDRFVHGLGQASSPKGGGQMPHAARSPDVPAPLFAIVDTARHSDSGRAREVCADILLGEPSGARKRADASAD